MTDYLTNLLDKAFDFAPVIQPSRVSLYAPSQNAFGSLGAGSIQSAADMHPETTERSSEREIEGPRLRRPPAPQPPRRNSLLRQPDGEMPYYSATVERGGAFLDAPIEGR